MSTCTKTTARLQSGLRNVVVLGSIQIPKTIYITIRLHDLSSEIQKRTTLSFDLLRARKPVYIVVVS